MDSEPAPNVEVGISGLLVTFVLYVQAQVRAAESGWVDSDSWSVVQGLEDLAVLEYGLVEAGEMTRQPFESQQPKEDCA